MATHSSVLAWRIPGQPWALSLPDKELCLREALAVCTPPASKHFAEQIKGPCTASRVPDSSGGAGFPEPGTYRATLLSPSS